MLTGFLCAALALALLLLGALYRRVQQIPARVRVLVSEERAQALTALEEATAQRVGTITLALRHHQQDLEARLRAEIAASDARARLAERRAQDTATGLEAATGLVRELRTLIEVLGVLRPAESTAPAEASTQDDPSARATIEGLPPALETDPSEPAPRAALPPPPAGHEESPQ